MSDEPTTDSKSPPAQPTPAPSTWRVELVAVLVLLVVALPSLAWPAGRDQGIEGTTAMLVLRGWVPYRDVWSHSPPGGFSLLAAGFALLGPSPLSVRIIDAGWMALGVWGLSRLAGREAGPLAGLVAGVLLALSYYGQGDFWHTAQRDGFMVVPSIWALVFARREDAPGAALAGLCVGAAAMFKPGGAAMALPVALAIGWQPRRLGLAAGCVAAAPALFGLLLLGTDAVEACRAGLVDFNRGYAAHYREHAQGRLRELVIALARLPVLDRPELALAVLGPFALAPRRRLALAWLAAAALSPVMQASLYPYHLLPLLAPLAYLAGIGISAVLERVDERRSLRLGVAALTVLASLDATLGVLGHARTSLAIVRGTMADGDYNEQFAAAREYELMAAHIREHGEADDRVLLWGSDPQLLLLAGRAPADRYLVSFALVAPWGAVDDREHHVERLRASAPRWVVVRSGDHLPWLSGTADDSAATLARYPELLGFLRANYRMVRTSPRLLLLRRANDSR